MTLHESPYQGRQEVKNFTSEKVCMKKAVVLSGALAPTLTLTLYFVASPRIELGSGASETLILSIVLRGRGAKVIFRR